MIIDLTITKLSIAGIIFVAGFSAGLFTFPIIYLLYHFIRKSNSAIDMMNIIYKIKQKERKHKEEHKLEIEEKEKNIRIKQKKKRKVKQKKAKRKKRKGFQKSLRNLQE